MPSMTVFDAPDGTTPVADRPQTTIAPQALLLMNNPQVRDASRQFAMRLQSVAQSQPLEAAVKLGYLTTLSREPSPDELSNTSEFLRQQAASYSTTDPNAGLHRALIDFCQVLFCLNEFIYTEGDTSLIALVDAPAGVRHSKLQTAAEQRWNCQSR